MIEHEGHLRGDGRRFGIVVGRFNDLITRPLLAGAGDCLVRHGVADDAIEAVWVPGAWEIPAALRRLARSGRFDALIALGCVIRGGTPHFEYVSGQVASGVATVGSEASVPVVFGVLTTDTIEQAIERAGTKAGNKGWEAALAALEMADLFSRLDGAGADARE
ncbi:MAG: 6,7-dimethyl-8-ribityllumazine synthase [Gemmatimonadota bacterium]|jgi:6,7-dimethyl-8-ribityllumazine synthase|nr:6,7-dimethyl-8-ribityllumazine synthase [Gemmatimonadota bacterium]